MGQEREKTPSALLRVDYADGAVEAANEKLREQMRNGWKPNPATMQFDGVEALRRLRHAASRAGRGSSLPIILSEEQVRVLKEIDEQYRARLSEQIRMADALRPESGLIAASSDMFPVVNAVPMVTHADRQMAAELVLRDHQRRGKLRRVSGPPRWPALEVKRLSLVEEAKIIRRMERKAVVGRNEARDRLAADAYRTLHQISNNIAARMNGEPLPELRPNEAQVKDASFIQTCDHARMMLSQHRRKEVRNEGRATLLALACLRGKPYAEVEPRTSLSQEQFEALIVRVYRLVRRYGARWTKYPSTEDGVREREGAIRIEDTATKFWLDEALACYKSRVTGM